MSATSFKRSSIARSTSSARSTEGRRIARHRPETEQTVSGDDDFYESIADRFEGLDNAEDVRRRLSVVFDECLGHRRLVGRWTLDAGCGYGPFSEAAVRRGAVVISVDLGERLVARTIVLEHTRAPERAVKELARVLRVDGLLVLTTPNRVWQGPVRAASRLRLRPFHGVENFVAWRSLEHFCRAAGLDVVLHLGFHPWPFQLGRGRAAATVEKQLSRRWAARLMVNQAIVARKPPPTASATRLDKPAVRD
ncbi:MAG: methyltransferase domain-containing protein [Candidatus Rokuibacteriota bacterium]|nr:MAG: methyltransferase domain-containing protein [Candidatus Rokubacteria bacterium]